ncbi:MAG: DUF4340 domain-containing protein [Eubacteriales bacterium]|nr:DUF4340 domain-containing protein [Eubacteriales bacterium]
MQNNNQNERVRPRLESASELKGKKAEGKSSSIGKKRATILVSLLLVIALATGAYFLADSLRPEPEEQPEQTGSELTTMLSGRDRYDMASMTIYHDGVEQYTIVSNLKEKADAAAAQEAAQQAAESAGEEQAEQLEGLAGAVDETIGNVLGTMNVADDMQQIAGNVAPQMLNTPAPTLEETEAPAGLDLEADKILDPLEKQDYEIKGMPYFTTDYNLVNPLAVYSYSITANRLVQEDCEDMAAYGLAEPKVEVLFRYHDGGETRFKFGNKVPTGDYYYVSLDDTNDVYMVYQTVYNYFIKDVNALHAVPQAPAIDPENLVYLLAEQSGKETVEIVMRDSSVDSASVAHVMLIQPFDYDVNSDRASATMISASALKPTAYAGYAPDEAALAEFGLAEPFAHVEVADVNDVYLKMTIGDVVEGNSAYRYATVDETGDVYTVAVSLLSFLEDCRASYLVDQFANLINIKRVEGFTIETPEKTYEVEVINTPYTNESGNELLHQDFYLNGEYVDEELFRDFYQVVIGRLVDKRIENEEEYLFEGETVLSVSYQLDYQEEPHVIRYLDYDRDYCAVSRDGVSLFLIRKDKVLEIAETAELLLKGEYEGIDDTIDYDEIYGDLSYYE